MAWLALDAPRPPLNTLARLIQSSTANTDHTDPASVRAAQAAEVARVLRRHLLQVRQAPVLQDAYRRIGHPNIIQVLTRRLASLATAR